MWVGEVGGGEGQNLKLKFAEYLNFCTGLRFAVWKKVSSPHYTCIQQEGLSWISKAALNYFLYIQGEWKWGFFYPETHIFVITIIFMQKCGKFSSSGFRSAVMSTDLVSSNSCSSSYECDIWIRLFVFLHISFLLYTMRIIVSIS